MYVDYLQVVQIRSRDPILGFEFKSLGVYTTTKFLCYIIDYYINGFFLHNSM